MVRSRHEGPKSPVSPEARPEAENFYDRLGVMPDASPQKIRGAFVGLSKRYHPDISTGDAEVMKRLTQAYDAIGKKANRVDYDASARLGVPYENYHVEQEEVRRK